MIDNNDVDTGKTLEEWVMYKAETWQEHYRQNYKSIHDEYYRLWRGIWAEEDKTRKSERSRIIAPALQQAVESSVAEIEEATFGRGKWFDLTDNMGDINKSDIEGLRSKLHEDFIFAKVRKDMSEVILNSAVFGTGLAEVVLDVVKQSTPASEPLMNGQLKAVGVNIKDRTIIKLKPILPKNFFIDPLATSVDEAMGVGVDEFVSRHKVLEQMEAGIYDDVDIGDASEDLELEADESLTVYQNDKIRLTRYYGLVPVDLLRETGEIIPEEHTGEFIEAMVVVANQGTLVKAVANPYMMQDRNIIAFSWDTVPSRFWGRGVCEKGYNSQKALDAELRARIDALALTVHPMMAIDATRIPRGTKPEIRAGKLLLTNGNPAEILQPFNFGQVNQITFAQASALQDMVQQSTGAVDTSGISGAVNGESTAAGISMSLGAVIKRHKRTLLNFQDGFLLPFVAKAAWRYMQFEPDEYPVYDYKFTAASSLGIMAREYEVTQLVQLLQTMGKDSPMYLPLIGSVIDNMNISNRQELLEQIKQMQQPDEAAQQQAQAAAKAAEEFQQAQTGMVAAQGKESTARAFKYMEEAKSIPKELEIDKIRAITANLDTGEQDDREFSRRLQTADRYLKDKELNIKQQAGREALQTQGNTMVPQVPQSLPEQLPAESQGVPQE
jgi:hypothetical protein